MKTACRRSQGRCGADALFRRRSPGHRSRWRGLPCRRGLRVSPEASSRQEVRLPGVLTRSGLLSATVFAFEATPTTAERVAGLRVVLRPWRLERGPLTAWRAHCVVEHVVELGVSEEA